MRKAFPAWCFAFALLVLGAPAVQAKVDVKIEGVDKDIEANLMVFLSLNRYRERNDIDADTMARLQERVDREVKDALRPFGYYAPSVTTDVKSRNEGRDWDVHVQIDHGPAVVVEDVSIEVTGPGADEKMFTDIKNTTELAPGRRLLHAAYDKTKGDLQRVAVSSGYLDAKFTRNELLVDPTNLTASAHISLETGQRYKFGPTTIEQDIMDPELVQRYLRYREGDWFDALKLLRTQFALDDSAYFSNVEVLPGMRDTAALTVPVAIKAQPAKKNKYTVGFGYGTDTRWRGTLGWDNRRLNRKGHRFHVEFLGASTEQSVKALYAIPVGDPALERVTGELEWSHEVLADLDVYSTVFTPGLTQIRGRWQRVLFTDVEHTITDSGTESQTDTLLVPGISYALLPASFSGEQVVFGRGLYLELTGSTSALGSDADFLQFHARDEHIFDLTKKLHLILRGELGLSAVKDFTELPGSRRFFAGGDLSVRGFGLNELSPIDADGNKTGGRHLVVASIEFEHDLPRNLGVAVFFDTGNAVNKIGDPLEYSAGIGFRWRIPVVTLGIDIAQALSRSDLSPRLHLNIQPRLQ